jgi:hypothetical protein
MLEKEYLEELARPQKQTDFINQVKLQYKKLGIIQDTKIVSPIAKGVDFIFDKVLLVLIRMERPSRNDDVDWDMNFEEMWFNKIHFRKMLFRKHKTLITSIIKKALRETMRGVKESKSAMKEYISEANKLQKYFKDNKEIYDSIEKRWYNIFGGPASAVSRRTEMSAETAGGFSKAIKIPDHTASMELIGAKYIMGISDSYGDSNIIEHFMTEKTHRHIIMKY